MRCQHGGVEPADKLAALLKGDGVKKIGSLSQWVEYVNAAATKRELQRLATSTARGQPFGDESWVRCTVSELGLEYTIRPEGRPLQTKTAEADT